ncbi:circadian clock KaiB family protein [Thiococcus pfennigii]|jgi:circadian clock protein KaiB|uniref:circadian clock KaiB family protein n=1 Tax=Thiococcus pfennigii TaxID=1057 RepID=UPI001905036F|nr:circadian clock KaiB family protein [Thiococcus pfennigii]MBK1731624.1 circadian clock protein KaiB [Thiococcus pfennigii]
MSGQLLRLYIAGRTAAASRAIANLEAIVAGLAAEGQQIAIEVIDILERPQLAEDERILATPVVIKKLPPPVRRVVGDLSEHDKVLVGLDLKEA